MNFGTFQPGGASLPISQVEVSVRCENLIDRDLTSKSDPTCVFFVKKSDNSGDWVEYGRTEKIEDSHNPKWKTKFVIDYRFEERQILKLAIYDIDSNNARLDDHDFLGQAEFSLGEVMAQQSKGFVRNLCKGGKVFVHAEELSSNRETVEIKFEGQELDKKDLFGKSDPFFEISRANESNDYSVVYRSEVIKNTLDPKWKTISLEVRVLCNGDYDRSLRFDVFDKDGDGSHDLIGSFQTNLRRLIKGPGSENIYDCINEKKRQKKGSKYKNSGSLLLKHIQIEPNPSFLEFIQGGLQVNFTVAIDFTGSNGRPTDPNSLHYRDPTGRPNQYVTAIQAVGEIIQDYDSDKQFPCLGFGARIPPSGEVSHEFFLTLDSSNPFCSGIEGILSSYYTSLNTVQLYGPTNFSPVINHVAKFAQVYQSDPTNYFVLLIITDGIITDLEETKSALVAASHLPLSVIIVGVGMEDFSAMEMLDGDTGRLQSDGKVAVRDIVQFVELRKFVQQGGHGWNKELLAKSLLAEIPKQVCGWMKSNGFKPLARN
eukprot:GFUD01132614.1.p1 GENE.GFUD01132614.1~~GFUD01132614.1.p1  ORF type:complete len:541 (-),score=123.21 GFUD01132614.1:342-1964(-)